MDLKMFQLRLLQCVIQYPITTLLRYFHQLLAEASGHVQLHLQLWTKPRRFLNVGLPVANASKAAEIKQLFESIETDIWKHNPPVLVNQLTKPAISVFIVILNKESHYYNVLLMGNCHISLNYIIFTLPALSLNIAINCKLLSWNQPLL